MKIACLFKHTVTNKFVNNNNDNDYKSKFMKYTMQIFGEFIINVLYVQVMLKRWLVKSYLTLNAELQKLNIEHQHHPNHQNNLIQTVKASSCQYK